MFRELVGFALLASVVACGGEEGPHWQGSVEHDGVTVEYETYYAPPSLIEKINNSDGIAARIAIDGKTMMLSPGVNHPANWEERGNFMEYTPEFWREVANKFKAVDPGKDHEDEHYLLNNLLETLRDSQRTLPPTPATQALTVAPTTGRYRALGGNRSGSRVFA